MNNNADRAPAQVLQFRNLTEQDQRLINRLHTDRTQPKSPKKHVDITAVNEVFQRTLRNSSDIRNIFLSMPDLNLHREILVSAICAPGDLATTTLIMSSGIGGGSNPLTSAIIDALEQFHIKEQDLPSKIPNWIDDAYIMSGAHPIMIIPEASIDRMIHGGIEGASLESINTFAGEWQNDWFKPKGILGINVGGDEKANYLSLESSFGATTTAKMAEYHTIKAAPNSSKLVKLPIRVTDNMAVFRLPAVSKIRQAGAMERAYGTPSLESRRRERLKGKEKDGGITNAQVYAKFFKPPQGTKRSRLEVVPTLKQVGGNTFGHPLVYHLPIEAVMPVCVPGDETNHIGYIVILDQNGYPVSYSRRLDYYNDVRRNGSDQSAIAGELLQMTKETLGSGGITQLKDAQLDRLAALHGDIIDADLIARLKSGLMNSDFELSRTDHVDRLLFSRTMKNQMTTLLYVPAELMIYMAFDYNEFGVGKSILEDAKSLAAMRAALTTANVIGSSKAAIPGKDINIELDPEDGDPVGTATFMANEAMNLNYQEFPMTPSTPQGLAQKLQMSGMSINVTGNPRYPDVKTTVTQRESSFTPVDQAILNQLRDDLTRVFSLTPEMVDGANQPDFATTVVRNSLMLLKRVMVIQGLANPQIADYVRIFTMNSGVLIEQLMGLIESNKKHLPEEYADDPEGYLEDFLNALQVKLPSPENESMKVQLEQIQAYSNALDTIIPTAYLRDEFLDGYSTEMAREAMPSLIAAWKGEALRQFMRERGMFRELDIFGNNEDGSPLFVMEENHRAHIESMIKGFGTYATRAAKDALARKEENEKLRILDAEAKATLVSPPEASEPPVAETEPAGDANELGAEEPGTDLENPAETTEPVEPEANAEEETPEAPAAEEPTTGDDASLADDDFPTL